MITPLRLSTGSSGHTPPIFELVVNKVRKKTFIKTYNLTSENCDGNLFREDYARTFSSEDFNENL